MDEENEFDDNLSNIIILNDENGNEVQFEFLDLIEYESEEYVVLKKNLKKNLISLMVSKKLKEFSKTKFFFYA